MAAVLVGSVVAVGSASNGTRIAAGVTVAAVLVGVLRYPFAQMRGRRTGPVIVLISVGLIGSALSLRAEAGLAAGPIGPFTGPARVVDDPRPYRSATWVIIDIDGSRHEIWARSNSDRRRVASLRAGEWVVVSGEREPLDPDRARRVAWQHVIGSFRVDWLGDVTSGGPPARASNRVRSLVADGATLIGEPDDSLLRGLVIGDDLDQPPEMIERFRRSGLSHLTAVSGQNVTLVLAAGAPLLRRLGSRTRLVTTVALIVWFVAITRFEPSILRAGTMAVLATVGTHLGRERTPMRMLALALSLLVVIDPLITRSVGLWLSVGSLWPPSRSECDGWIGSRSSVIGSNPSHRCTASSSRSPSAWRPCIGSSGGVAAVSRRWQGCYERVRMSIHLLTGDDESNLRSAVTELVHELVGDGDRSLMVDEFDGTEYGLREVVDAAQTPPFLTESRVVVARGIGRFVAADIDDMKAYLADPLPTTHLVLVGGGGAVTKPLVDAVKAGGGVTRSTSVSTRGRDLETWVRSRVEVK
ncbi:MAG: ComEC/Rec2 family competence protein, partial [Ilumatobacteraceae bacterium]